MVPQSSEPLAGIIDKWISVVTEAIEMVPGEPPRPKGMFFEQGLSLPRTSRIKNPLLVNNADVNSVF